MQTSLQIRKNMIADKRLTASRSRSKLKHNNYSNLYTLALKDYDGINNKGYFTKFYPYGVAGHCCIFVQAHLIWAGYPQLVPHKGYIWNTNNYARWLKSEPTIKGLGKVDWTTDWKKARDAARAGKKVVVFKGRKGHGSYTHTCSLLDIEDGYVKTVDGNVTGKYKGKTINNGVVKRRKLSSYRWGFAILPIPVKLKPKKAPKLAPYAKGKTYILQNDMNVRADHSSKSKKLGTKKKGTKVKAYSVYKTKNGVYWVRIDSDKWICAKTNKKTYMK